MSSAQCLNPDQTMDSQEATSLDDILKGTSRAFYLSLAILPGGARAPLSLAYLIARAADTLADSPPVSEESNQSILQRFHTSLVEEGRVLGVEPGLVRPAKMKEVELLKALPRLDHLLQARPPQERTAILEVVATLVEGMLWDQQLFARPEHNSRVERGLADEEFERYTYLVAGCVGPFWSRMCALSGPHLRHLLAEEHQTTAREFGKALQWVNIMRDTPQDQAQGRFYFPGIETPQFPERFLAQARRAQTAFRQACRYPLLFPSRELRHRLSVLWPLALGLRTLEKLFKDGGPRPNHRVKVSRAEVICWVVLSPLIVATDRGMELVLAHLLERCRLSLNALEEIHC